MTENEISNKITNALCDVRHYSELFGFHSFPSFMYSKYIGEIQKVFLFREYINNIVNRERPQVLIIGAPHGIMNVSESDIDNYGMVLYLMSAAVQINHMFFCIPFFYYNNDFLKRTTDLLKIKYNVPSVSLIASNLCRDEFEEERDVNSICVLPDSMIKKHLNNLDNPDIVDVWDLKYSSFDYKNYKLICQGSCYEEDKRY